MAFTREGNRDAFLGKSGYTTLENLQVAIESGSLLQRYDLDTPQNRTRYHKNTLPSLVGGASLAPNSSADPTLDHCVVDQLNPATATSPQRNLLAMVAQYVPFRDVFYHRDKQREVAKGLDDLYKELQRVQTETRLPSTYIGRTTTKAKLTAAQAGKIISQRRYHASRTTLEQLAVDLGYVGEIDITHPLIMPYGIAPPPPTADFTRVPTPDAIRAAYEQPLNWKRPETYLQRIPEGVLSVIRGSALIGTVAAATVGAYVPLAMYVGGQLTSGVTGSVASHFVRRAGRDYITTEDGLQNAAQLAGRLGGLAAYSATASAIAGGLALTWVTGALAGSAVTRYIANKKRQNARDNQRQLEEKLQPTIAAGGYIPPTANSNVALVTQIQNDIQSAERYEAASAGFDIISLLGLVGGTAYKALGHGSISGHDGAPKITHTELVAPTTTPAHPTLETITSGTDDAPTIDNLTLNSQQHGHVVKVGDTVDYKIDIDDKPSFGDKITDVSAAITHPNGTMTTEHLYVNGFMDKVHAFFGDSHLTEKGKFTADGPGDYNIHFTASDNQNHTTTKDYWTTITGDGNTTPTPGPHPVPTPTPSGTDSAPSITHTIFNNGNTNTTFDKTTTDHVGYTLRAEDDHALDKITSHLYKVNSAGLHSVEVKDIYPDNSQDRIQHMLGWNTANDGDTINIQNLAQGNYIINADATDNIGQHSLVADIGRFTVTEGHGPSPTPGPHPGPSPVPGTTPADASQFYGKDLTHTDLREVYDYHNTPLTPEAGHEQGLHINKDWSGGTVSLNGLHDEHTPCNFNVDNTHILVEHYNATKHIDFRTLVDVDANGHYDLSGTDIAKYHGDGVQITWAQATHVGDTKLGLEDLASWTGKHVDIPKESVFEGTIPTHVAPHYVDCGNGIHHGTGSASVHAPAPIHSFDLSINEIPKNPSEQFTFTAKDTFADGLLYTVDIRDSHGTLVDHTIYRDAPGIFAAQNNGFIPEFTAPGTFSAEMWGNDIPHLASDSEPRFTWTLESGSVPQVPHYSVDHFDFTGTDSTLLHTDSSVSHTPITTESGMDLTQNILFDTTHPFDYHIDQKVIEEFLRNHYWYLDEEAIQRTA